MVRCESEPYDFDRYVEAAIDIALDGLARKDASHA
jgi:hypothetical protein